LKNISAGFCDDSKRLSLVLSKKEVLVVKNMKGVEGSYIRFFMNLDIDTLDYNFNFSDNELKHVYHNLSGEEVKVYPIMLDHQDIDRNLKTAKKLDSIILTKHEDIDHVNMAFGEKPYQALRTNMVYIKTRLERIPVNLVNPSGERKYTILGELFVSNMRRVKSRGKLEFEASEDKFFLRSFEEDGTLALYITLWERTPTRKPVTVRQDDEDDDEIFFGKNNGKTKNKVEILVQDYIVRKRVPDSFADVMCKIIACCGKNTYLHVYVDEDNIIFDTQMSNMAKIRIAIGDEENEDEKD
jgi:hypothetical protein